MVGLLAASLLPRWAAADFRGEVYRLSVEAGSTRSSGKLSYGQTAKIAGTLISTGERVVLLAPLFDRLEIEGQRATLTFPAPGPSSDPIQVELEDLVMADDLILDRPDLCLARGAGVALVLTVDRSRPPDSVTDFEDEAERRAWERSHRECDAAFGEEEERRELWNEKGLDLDIFLGQPIEWQDARECRLYCATVVDGRCWDRGLPHGLASLSSAITERESNLAVELIRRLEAVGIALDPPEKNRRESAPLAMAVEAGEVAIVDTLLEAGADPTRREDGEGLLRRAAARGRLSVVERLLAAGVDPDQGSDDGWSPLMAALNAGRPAVAERLLEAGAGVETRLDDGRSVLAFALEEPSMARRLVDAGARPGEEAAQLMHLAVERGDQRMVERLLQVGVDVDIRAAFDRTPLITAAQEGDPRMLDLLLDRGARVEAVDELRESAFVAAVGAGNLAAAKRLAQTGADPDARMSDGETLLTWAAGCGHLEAVELLLALGADPEKKNAAGQKPLEIARQRGYRKLVVRLGH